MALNLTKNLLYIKSIVLYENEKQFYFVGKDNLQSKYHIFTFKKLIFNSQSYETLFRYTLSDLLVEFSKEYSKQDFKQLVTKLNERSETTLKKVYECEGILGFVKFCLGYYVILIMESKEIGKINKYIIHRTERTLIVPLFDFSQIKQEKVYEYETKYTSIFQQPDFNKQMYFSKTYNLTKTLQRNFIENLKSEILINYDEHFLKSKQPYAQYTSSSSSGNNNNKTFKNKPLYDIKKITNNTFLWNHYHLKEFFNCLDNKIWCIYCIHGYVNQIQCSIYGLRFLVTVIARRNRHFAGTRYLKRGINNDGNVANDVETEQILEETSTTWADQPIIASFVHIRGSVPIYWHQEHNMILPKPEIKVNLTDFTFDATKRHFYLLTQRYGIPCIVCNLTKTKENKKPQETLLNHWYKEGVDYINEHTPSLDNEKIEYVHYDLKALRKEQKFYKRFCDESCLMIRKTNMFCFIPRTKSDNTYMLSLQNGVIRSNCIDCLDRTNVYQQIIGTAVMMIQLRMMGVQALPPQNETEEIYGVLTEIYKEMGNVLSCQYAGSQAHKQTIEDKGTKVTKLFQKVPEFLNTFQRYFHNTFNDQSKQNGMNLFLGKYKINQCPVQIWDVVNDTDLHKKKKLKCIGDNWIKDGVEYYTTFNLIDDIVDKFSTVNTITSKAEVFELGKEFNLDVIEKITIKRCDKPVPIMTAQAYKDLDLKDIEYNGSNSDNDSNAQNTQLDYLITLDKYLNYKKTHPLKYKDQILFQKEIPIFSLLDIDTKTQIKSFENFS